MANLKNKKISKKKSAPKTRVKKNFDVKSAYKKVSRSLALKFKIKVKKAQGFFKNIPNWVKSRPAAIQTWYKEDKKKKKYRSFRLQKRIRPEPRYVPPAGQLLRQTFKMFFKNFWVFFFLMFIHACLYYIFVRGGSALDLEQARESIRVLLGNNSTAGTFALLGTVLGSNQQREGSGIYSFLIILVVSLAYIWAIRRIYANKRFYIRDAFYQGLGPAIPFLMILIVMTLQSLPFTVTSYIYITGRTNNLFISGIEDLSFFMVAVFCGLLSVYWMTTSVLSLYAVTLPNMYPIRTLRLSKKIVAFRRFQVFRRIIAFPIIIGVVSLGILLMAIRFIPQFSPLLVEGFAIILLPLLHGYYFNLYRSLI